MKLDFSNVLIRPRKTTLCSRKQVNLFTNYDFKHSNFIAGISLEMMREWFGG